MPQQQTDQHSEIVFNNNNNNSKFDIAHWSIDKSMFSGALWYAQEIKYQMQVQS